MFSSGGQKCLGLSIVLDSVSTKNRLAEHAGGS